MEAKYKSKGYIKRECPNCGIEFKKLGWVRINDPTEEIVSHEDGCPSCGKVYIWPEMKELDRLNYY